jgi:hypothetical protein
MRCPFSLLPFPFCLLPFLFACAQPSAPQIHLDLASPHRPIVEVTGLSRGDLARFSQAHLTADEWTAVLRVTVKGAPASGGALPVAGRHAVGASLQFLPMFPLDPGREYDVVFDPSQAPAKGLPSLDRLASVVSVPAPAKAATTVVTEVFPSGGVVPENLLRMYIQFSAPMGLLASLEHLSLVDGDGRELTGALLPLDTELWSPDRTRLTVLFDPGRVKRQILPNREMGRPLRSGGRFTFIVRKTWRDGQGMPLASEFRKEYRVGPADERALSTKDWRIAAPAAGSRDPLTVTFGKPLDQGLAQRALGVTRDGAAVPGDARVEAGETRWVFVPKDPWSSGEHALAVLPMLEDPAGNRIGRAFEVISTDDEGAPERREPHTIPFRAR